MLTNYYNIVFIRYLDDAKKENDSFMTGSREWRERVGKGFTEKVTTELKLEH